MQNANVPRPRHEIWSRTLGASSSSLTYTGRVTPCPCPSASASAPKSASSPPPPHPHPTLLRPTLGVPHRHERKFSATCDMLAETKAGSVQLAARSLVQINREVCDGIVCYCVVCNM
eukprot:scaffold118062_cov40-Tisochrysis_lutea.AAC.2